MQFKCMLMFCLEDLEEGWAETLALYKLFTYLLTYLRASDEVDPRESNGHVTDDSSLFS